MSSKTMSSATQSVSRALLLGEGPKLTIDRTIFELWMGL